MDFQITDGEGAPLDLEGRLTRGEVEVRFILSRLGPREEGAPGHYTAYTTRSQTGEDNGITVEQASTDSGGRFTPLGDEPGTYRYTLGTTVEPPNPSLTHTVGAYATREVDGRRAVSNDVLDFVPDGSTTTDTRAIVTDDACNNCHGEVSAHGGARRGVRVCALCHTEQTVDPDTGRTLDLNAMIHKIHRGEDLPSVQDGEAYAIIGYMGSIHDYSNVRFPQPMQNCETCHRGPDADVWLMDPSREACTTCHDRTSFQDPPSSGFTLHGGGSQPNDAQCAVCHPPAGSIAGIRESHFTVLTDPSSPEITLEILDIDDTSPSERPTLTFRVEVNGIPRDILGQPLTGLRATIAGPNPGIEESFQADIQGSSPEGSLSSTGTRPGLFAYEFAAEDAIPLDAEGSYTVGLEGFIGPPGARVPAQSPTMAFAVTDPEPVERSTIVSAERCNACHGALVAHGGQRTDPNYCVLCHHGENANDERVARLEGSTVTAHSVDFRVMIHRIHAGEHRTQPYVLGGYPLPEVSDPAGTPIDFTDMRYPRSPSECAACHLEGTFGLPVPSRRTTSLIQEWMCSEPIDDDGNAYCNDPDWTLVEETRISPERATCTGCHDEPATAAHAELMTTSMGDESCGTCHGEGASVEVVAAHGGEP